MAINTATKIHQGKNRVKLLRHMQSQLCLIPATDCNELRKKPGHELHEFHETLSSNSWQAFLGSILQQGGGSGHGLHGSSSKLTNSASAPTERCASGRCRHRRSS